jgi:hypothetical protein
MLAIPRIFAEKTLVPIPDIFNQLRKWLNMGVPSLMLPPNRKNGTQEIRKFFTGDTQPVLILPVNFYLVKVGMRVDIQIGQVIEKVQRHIQGSPVHHINNPPGHAVFLEQLDPFHKLSVVRIGVSVFSKPPDVRDGLKTGSDLLNPQSFKGINNILIDQGEV